MNVNESDFGAGMRNYMNLVKDKRREMKLRIDAIYQEVDTPDKAYAFLIYFSGLGFHMTRNVKSWMQRAGQSCILKGYENVGRRILEHALEEEGHEQLFYKDWKSLLRDMPPTIAFSPKENNLIEGPIPPSVEAYHELHESVIVGDTPYALQSLAGEIELVSLLYGRRLMARMAEFLGFGILAKMSFVKAHAQLDNDHCKDNFRHMDSFLKSSPEAIEPLVRVAEQAIEIYTQFLEHCAWGTRNLTH